MNRRAFLQALTALGISAPALPGMAALSTGDTDGNTQRPRHLVLIELQGGNDGLNTVVPYTSPDYRRLRPKIALTKDQVIPLDEQLGLHPVLSPLMPLWDQQQLSIVQGVGYPDHNRSHFRSIEIWETASDADETLINGWLKPVASSLKQRGPNAIKAMALGEDEGPLAGATDDTVIFNNLNGFVRQAQQLDQTSQATDNDALRHLQAVEKSTRSAALAFASQLDEQQASLQPLPDKASRLMQQLALIARLIEQDVGPQIYKVHLGSFDTHAGQLNRHRTLLKQFADAVTLFKQNLTATGHWNDVLLMTYSEFGRRANENGSAGTDHGTAAPHFVMGGKVRGGLHGQAPDLKKLLDNDLRHTIDFRQLYSTVSRQWFNQAIADTPYSEYETLPLLG